MVPATYLIRPRASPAWYVAVSVKAVKTLNGFGTARAFGLLVVAHVGYGAASWPPSMG